MMKNIFILLLILLTTSIYSQNNKNCLDGNSYKQNNKIYFDFLTAAAVPLGNFAATNLDGGSYAITGFSATAQVSWMAFGNIGLRIGASTTFNPVDAVSWAQDELAADEFMEDLSIRSEAYRIYNFFGSVLYEKKLNHKFDIIASLGLGMIYVETPHQLHRARHFLVGDNYFEITAAGDYTLMYNAAIEAEYKIKESWSIIGGSKFNYANAQFVFTVAGSDNRIDDRKITMLDAFVGFRLYF